MPASDADSTDLSAANVLLSYQVVGGKSGAPVETIRFDCTAKQVTLDRQTQSNVSIYKQQASLNADQCAQLATLAAPLCQSAEKQQDSVFDAAGYQLTCSGKKLPVVTFSWQGTLRKSPEALRPWHDYTRQLIKSSFAGANAYQ